MGVSTAGTAAVKPVVSPPAKPRARASTAWVPERQHVIRIDCNPQAGSEMRDVRPMLVLSYSAFNARTGSVVGLPMTTAAFNAKVSEAVFLGACALLDQIIDLA